ncbi:MAG: magnesium/cobalt transporter CorA [Flavobacteriales bacterium]
MPPGNLDYHGEVFSQNKDIELISYSKDTINRISTDNLGKALSLISENHESWINLVGLHNVDHIKAIGNHFNIHHLVLEDILNTDHRPKTELYDGYLFFIAKMFLVSQDDNYQFEQVSFIVGKDYLLTFQEKEGDVFNIIRERLDDKDSRLRIRKSDYLFYRLVDTIVDGYYYTLEHIADKIELLEDRLQDNPSKEDYKEIQQLKRDLIFLRKSVYPLREAIAKITKENNDLIEEDNITYFNDVYDHCIHIIDSIETFRDLTSSLMDLYMTSMSNKMNEVMKVLTVISTIFIPITFVAGVYGMNFQYMPELTHKWGYPITMIVMTILVIVMIVYFKIKKWF